MSRPLPSASIRITTSPMPPASSTCSACPLRSAQSCPRTGRRSSNRNIFDCVCFHTFTRGFSHRHRCRRHRRRSVFPCGGFAVFIRSLYYGRTTLEGSVFQGGGQPRQRLQLLHPLRPADDRAGYARQRRPCRHAGTAGHHLGAGLCGYPQRAGFHRGRPVQRCADH